MMVQQLESTIFGICNVSRVASIFSVASVCSVSGVPRVSRVIFPDCIGAELEKFDEQFLGPF